MTKDFNLNTLSRGCLIRATELVPGLDELLSSEVETWHSPSSIDTQAYTSANTRLLRFQSSKRLLGRKHKSSISQQTSLHHWSSPSICESWWRSCPLFLVLTPIISNPLHSQGSKSYWKRRSRCWYSSTACSSKHFQKLPFNIPNGPLVDDDKAVIWQHDMIYGWLVWNQLSFPYDSHRLKFGHRTLLLCLKSWTWKPSVGSLLDCYFIMAHD